MYQVMLVWNREFDFVRYGDPHADLDAAIRAAKIMEALGDGECVKKTRVERQDGVVMWEYGRKTAAVRSRGAGSSHDPASEGGIQCARL